MNFSVCGLLDIYSKDLRSFGVFCFYCMKVPIDVVFPSG